MDRGEPPFLDHAQILLQGEERVARSGRSPEITVASGQLAAPGRKRALTEARVERGGEGEWEIMNAD